MTIKPRFVAFLLLISPAIALLARLTTLPMGGGDADRYLKMAQMPGTFIGSPWGYRIAIPYVVAAISSLTGLPLVATFTALQFAVYSLFLTTLFLWLYRVLAIDVFSSVMACLIFVYSYPGIYNIHNTIHVGFSEYLLVLVGCIAIYRGQFRLLALTVAASCMVKESVGFILVPSYFLSSILFGNRRAACANTAILGAIVVGLHVFVRSGILFNERPHMSAYASYYSKDYFREVYKTWGGTGGCIKQIMAVFGPLWLLALLGIFASPPKLRVLAIVPIMAILQIPFATDVSRMVAVGMPVLLAFTAHALRLMDGKYAFALSSINCLYFLARNHGISTKPCLAISLAATSVVLWRSDLLSCTAASLACYGAALKPRSDRHKKKASYISSWAMPPRLHRLARRRPHH